MDHDPIRRAPEERRLLLSRFQIADGAAPQVGGVGSVGTRCTIFLLEGGAEDDALILQEKEASLSVLAPYVARREYASHRQGSGTPQAKRVVVGQRLMQAASDIFLGWHESSLTGRPYYWRQLKDMKGSVDVASLDEAGLRTYLAVSSGHSTLRRMKRMLASANWPSWRQNRQIDGAHLVYERYQGGRDHRHIPAAATRPEVAL